MRTHMRACMCSAPRCTCGIEPRRSLRQSAACPGDVRSAHSPLRVPTCKCVHAHACEWTCVHAWVPVCVVCHGISMHAHMHICMYRTCVPLCAYTYPREIMLHGCGTNGGLYMCMVCTVGGKDGLVIVGGVLAHASTFLDELLETGSIGATLRYPSPSAVDQTASAVSS